MSILLSILALIISCVSLLWQVINGMKNLKIELNDWYVHHTNEGNHHVFRLAFINKSFNSISISSITIKYGNNTKQFDYEKTTLLYKPILNKYGNKEYENRLYSHEIPFRIDGLGVCGGYFGVWNLPEPELICAGAEIKIILNTNRGKVSQKLIVPEETNMTDVRF